MLISKYIQIDFADSRIRAIDALHDIRKAAESAGLNLFSRYDVQLQYPMPAGGDKVVVEVKIPEEIINTFSIGNHLRGISAYLLKYCNGKYDQYQVGKRLLNYTEISEPTGNPDGPTMTERLEAVARFARLLERNDEDSLDKISQILIILKEAQQLWG